MKESYWGYWLIVLGAFVVVVLLLVQSFTSTNTQDYYMVKTITEAAMEDAIDYSYYRTYGEAKINKEKFEESFIRRFAEEASLTTTYTITFSDIYEAPPKVSVKVSSKAGGFSVTGSNDDIDIVNKIDAILESSQYSYTSGKEENIEVEVDGYRESIIVDTTLTNSLASKTIGYDSAGTGLHNLKVYYCGTPNYEYDGSDDNIKLIIDTRFNTEGIDTYCILADIYDPTYVIIAPAREIQNVCSGNIMPGNKFQSCI